MWTKTLADNVKKGQNSSGVQINLTSPPSPVHFHFLTHVKSKPISATLTCTQQIQNPTPLFSFYIYMTQSGPRFQLLFQLTLAPFLSLSLSLSVSSFSAFAFIHHPITPLYNGSFLFPIYWFMFNYSLPGFGPMPLSFDTEHEEAPPQLPPPQNSSNVPNQPKQLCFVCRHLGAR